MASFSLFITIPEDGDGLSDELLLSAVGELETTSLEKQEALIYS